MLARAARLLVVNGCEHTALVDGWADHLAAALDVPIVNLAAPRASNRRIVRTTTARLGDEVRSRGLRPEDVLFVAMFTELDRTEVGVEPARRRGRRSRDSTGPWRTIDREAWRAGDRQAQSWYTHLHHPVSDVVDLLLSVSLLGCWLERLRCRPVFALTEGWEVPAGAEALVRTYSDRIEPAWVLGGSLEAWPRTALLDGRASGTPVPSTAQRAWVERVLLPHLDDR